MARPPKPLADPVALARKAGRWAIRYYPTGLVGDPATRKLWRKSFATRAEAEVVADALRKELYALRAKTGAGLPKPAHLSPFDVIAEQAQASRQVKRQTKRERAEERALRAVPEEDDGDADRGLGLEDVPALADVTALRDAVIRRETVGNPARRHKGRGSKGGLRPLTEQQVRPSADSVTLRAAAGLRTCECLGVHTSRVKLNQGLIVVDRQLDRYRPWIPGEPPPLVPPKHNHAREARVWSMFMPTLEEWCWLANKETDGWLIVPTRGQKWPVDAHEKMVERAVALLAWEYQEATTQGDSPLPPLWKWKSHYLRHVYGSWSLASRDHGGLGWSITVVQESMGHVSERTTREIYRHVILPEREAARSASILWPGL